MKSQPTLSWDDVADLYKKHFGGTPRIRPMDEVFEKVKSLSCVEYDEQEGTLHRVDSP